MSIDIALVKGRISCVDYCQSKGIPITRSGGRCVSPLRQGASNKTSFVVFDDYWYDFGSASGGDVIDLCAAYEFGGDKGDAIRALAKRAGVEDDGSSAGWVQYTQQLNAKIALWHQNLSQGFRDYCNQRGITDATIDRLRIGQTPDGRLSIPYYKNGYVAYYITRYMQGGSHPDCKYMKQKKDDFCEHIPWGMWTLSRTKELLVIAEGAFDVLSFEQEGYACLSAITGHFSASQLPTVLRAAKTFDKVFLVYDNDVVSHAGEKFTVKMSKILFTNGIPFIVGKVPRGYKDVSEYYQAGGNLQELVDNAEDGVSALCTMLTDQKEFETTIRKACRYMSKTDVALLFAKIAKSSNWDESWLKVLKQECSNAPSEDCIAREIIDKYPIKYHRSVGFVQYNGKYWEKINDETVQGYIGDALGVYRTGNRLTSILKVVKSEVNSDELLDMNRHAVMNFLNGTLELEPNILFRDHQADDYCTYCLPYTYDPDARSTVWEDYLWTVTDFDQKKIALLQEWAGYGMFSDCSLHKALALIGEGRNGKSIFVNALMDVYGRSNISTVSMSDLTKDFHAIDLKYSLWNIASETRSDVTGAEEKFKKVTVGETIRDSYKGKDVTEFAPRAKWILNCNNFMTSKTDQSDGWIERFCFCEFKLRFVDDPQKPYERKADRTLEAKLKEPEQLSGIFNWALEGYRMLKTKLRFTEPDDQKATKEDFIEVTDPIVVWAKEFDIDMCSGHSITNDDLYANYAMWADNSRHNAMSRTRFSQRVPKVFRERRPDLETYRTSKSRGWRKIEDRDGTEPDEMTE